MLFAERECNNTSNWIKSLCVVLMCVHAYVCLCPRLFDLKDLNEISHLLIYVALILLS